MSLRQLPIRAALALALTAGVAQASSIQIAFSNNTACGTAVPFQAFQTFIYVALGGDAASGGMTGAEFRVDGYDPAWFNSVAPNPSASLALGTPVNAGCNIAFPICQGTVFTQLYVVTSFATAAIGPHTLTVLKHTTPSNPGFQCPLLTLCDAPVFTKLCVPGGSAYLNTGCPVAVEEHAWSAVKSLFR